MVWTRAAGPPRDGDSIAACRVAQSRSHSHPHRAGTTSPGECHLGDGRYDESSRRAANDLETLFCVQFYVNLTPTNYLLPYFEEDK